MWDEFDYYDEGFRRSTYLEAITTGPGLFAPTTPPPGYNPPISGMQAGPPWQGTLGDIGFFAIGSSGIGTSALPWLWQVGDIWGVPNLGIPYEDIGAFEFPPYLPGWTPTTITGGIVVLKQYHEMVLIVGTTVIEIGWGVTGGTFILDLSSLDGPGLLG